MFRSLLESLNNSMNLDNIESSFTNLNLDFFTNKLNNSTINTNYSYNFKLPYTSFPSTEQAINDARFVPLTRFRQQHRRTLDGRLCAAAFVQNEQPFTNCTTVPAPEGQHAGKEWCYVEPQLLGAGDGKPPFAECQPVPDYDDLRQQISEDAMKGTGLEEEVEG